MRIYAKTLKPIIQYYLISTLILTGCSSDSKNEHGEGADPSKESSSKMSAEPSSSGATAKSSAATTTEAKPTSLSPDRTVSSPSEIPDLDFKIEFYMTNGDPDIASFQKGALDATKIMLARLRVDYPSVYNIIKSRFRKANLSCGIQYAVPYEVVDSCAGEYRTGFHFDYVNYNHEFAHLIHWAIQEAEPALGNEVDTLFEAGCFVSDYASGNPMEFFAESSAAWFNLECTNWAADVNHANLKANCPDVYKFFEKIYLKPIHSDE
ncbi:MAG: hypothetical protein HQK54_05160 [Oligoflexales bacterium]|nr:hypothetical protein [Oligoflexales bacterium]